jgi:predicted nucleic acid-binding protein
VVPITTLYDACVLYPAPLRDLLMWLALTDVFRARWTDAIHEEWMQSLLKDRPDLPRARVERTRDRMNAYVRDCLVTEYEDLIEALTLPDPDDRHVLAAAIRAHADVIVTYNLDDYPRDILQGYRIEAQHPDEFVSRLLDVAPSTVYWAVRQQRENLKNPPRTAEQLLETLERQRLVQTVARLRSAVNLL